MAYTVSTGTTHTRGGSGGSAVTLTLANGEHIVAVRVDKGTYNGSDRVFYLSVLTNTGRTLAAGTQTASTTTFSVQNGFTGAVGFYGSAGNGVDKIGVIWGKND